MVIFADAALLPDGWAAGVRIAIGANGTIESVAANASPQGATLVRGALVPGMPNAHSHAFQRAMAGRAERRTHAHDDFWTWRETMYALANRLDPDAYYAIARDAFRAMLLAGYTSVAEFHYVHRDPAGHWYDDRAAMARAAIAAARDAGIAICLLPALYAHGDAGGEPLDASRKRFATGVDDVLTIAATLRRDYAHDPDVTVGICAHSLRAVTPDELHALVAGSPRDVPVHVHVAEQQREVDAVKATLGTRPVQWLLEHAGIDRRWCLVHATHLDAHERTALARSGATVALCPTTEANLGDGLFPLGPYLDEGGAIAIGSDSNVSIGVAEELRLLEYGQRLVTGRRHVAARVAGASCGEELFSRTARGGATALGRKTGAIAIGFYADLLALDARDDHAHNYDARDDGDERANDRSADETRADDTSPSDVLDRFVFASEPPRPSAVMVSGRWLEPHRPSGSAGF